MVRHFIHALLVLLGVSASAAWAQPISGTDYFPRQGVRARTLALVVQPLSIDSGANRFWDYTWMDSARVGHLTMDDTGGSVYPWFFPDDYVVMNLHGVITNSYYFKTGPTGYGLAGNGLGWNLGETSVYSRPKTLLPMSFAYGEEHRDTVSYTTYGRDTTAMNQFHMISSTRRRYIGYGTLALPGVVYENVIQVHTLDTIRWWIAGSPTLFQIEDRVEWYANAGVGRPVLEYTITHYPSYPDEFTLGALTPEPLDLTRYAPAPGTGGRWQHVGNFFNPMQMPPPTEGPGQNWDYTAFNNPIEFDPVAVQRNDGARPGTLFPGSNYRWTIAPDVGFYLQADTNGVSQLGFGPDDSTSAVPTLVYERPVRMLPAGRALGATYSDSLQSTQYVAGNSQRIQLRYSVRVAGLGTLLTPGGRFDEAILVHEIHRQQAAGQSGFYYIESYNWYAATGWGRPIAQWVHEWGSDPTTGHLYKFNYAEGITLARKPALGNTALTLCPNPAHGFITVSGLGQSQATGTLLDWSGRTIRTFRLDGTASIPVSDLKPGLYILTLDTPQGPITQRFVKE